MCDCDGNLGSKPFSSDNCAENKSSAHNAFVSRSITLSAWVRIAAGAAVSVDQQIVGGSQSENDKSPALLIGSFGAGAVGPKARHPFDSSFCGTDDTDTGVSSNRSVDMRDGEWHHLAMSYDARNYVTYFDGDVYDSCACNLTATNDCSWKVPELRRMQIGMKTTDISANNGAFAGLLDDIRAFSKRLSLAEIRDQMGGSKITTATPSLVFHLSLDQHQQEGFVDTISPFKLETMLGGGDLAQVEGMTGHKFHTEANSPVAVQSSAPLFGGYLVVEEKNNTWQGLAQEFDVLVNLTLTHPVAVGTLNSPVNSSWHVEFNTEVAYTHPQIRLKSVIADGVEHGAQNVTPAPALALSISSDGFVMRFVATDFSFVQAAQLIEVLQMPLVITSQVNNSSASCREDLLLSIRLSENRAPQAGSAGGAVSCDGVDDFMYNSAFDWPMQQFPDSTGHLRVGGLPITVEWWAQVNVTSAQDSAFITIGNAEKREWWVNTYDPHAKLGRLVVQLPYSDHTIKLYVGSSHLSTPIKQHYGGWAHYAFTHDQGSGTQMALLINGQVVASGTHDHETLLTANQTKGKGIMLCSWSFWSGVYFAGLVDEVRIWNRTRTPQEVRRAMHSKLSAGEPGLVSAWSFNEEDSGSTVAHDEIGVHDLQMGGCSPCTAPYFSYACAEPGSCEQSCLPSRQSASIWGGTHCYNATPGAHLPSAVPARLQSTAPVGGFTQRQVVQASQPEGIVIQLNGTDPDPMETLTYTLVLTNEASQTAAVLSYQDRHGTTRPIDGGLGSVTLPGGVSAIRLRLPAGAFQGGREYLRFSYTVRDHAQLTSHPVEVVVDVQCPVGRYVDSSHTCQQCLPGTFVADPGHFSRSCVACPHGQYQDQLGRSSCMDCQSGEFWTSASLPCGKCDPGKFAGSSSMCELCQVGRYSAEFGAQQCASCGVGQYQSQAGQGACADCPAGKFTINIMSAACNVCANCTSGIRRSGCSGAHQGLCLDCQPGNFISPASGLCTPCSEHQFQPLMNLFECELCPEGKFQPLEGKSHCLEVSNREFVQTRKVYDSVTKRLIEERFRGTCPGLQSGFTCDAGQLRYAQGYWHDGLVRCVDPGNCPCNRTYCMDSFVSEDTRFYACPVASNCLVDEASGSVQCKAGSHGVLCGECLDGYYPAFFSAGKSRACRQCPAMTEHQQSTRLHFLLVAVFGFPFLLALMFISVIRRVHRRCPWMRQHLHSGVAIGKMVVSFYQITCMIPVVFAISFPAQYQQFLGWLSVLAFDATHFIRHTLFCVYRADFHEILTIEATGVLAALGFVVCMFSARQCVLSQHWFHNPLMKAMSTVPVACLYLAYPSVSSSFFQALNCRSIDKDRWLEADLSIDCTDEQHRNAELVAWVMILIFSFGFPALCFAMLFPHRREICAQGGFEGNASSPDPTDSSQPRRAQPSTWRRRNRSDGVKGAGIAEGGDGCRRDLLAPPSPFYKAISFIYIDYKPRFWWWEFVELGRKFVLTGVMCQISKGSCLQIVFAILVILVHLICVVQCKPYKTKAHNTLAVFVPVVLLVVFFGGLLLSVKAETPEGSKFTENVSGDNTAYLLIVATMSVFLVSLALAVDEVRIVVWGQSVLRHTQTGRPVVFSHSPRSPKFHVFLSHTWASGQDQMQALKKELALCCPSLNVWLDVDNLEDLASLEHMLAATSVTLLFLSSKYFDSWNCLREVRQAVLLDEERQLRWESGGGAAGAGTGTGAGAASRTILMRETAATHGAEQMESLLGQCPEYIGCSEHVKHYQGGRGGCVECGRGVTSVREFLRAHSQNPAQPVLQWVRAKHFKTVTLKQVVTRVLGVVEDDPHPCVYLPGELALQVLAFPGGAPEAGSAAAPILLYRASHLRAEIEAVLEGMGGEVVAFGARTDAEREAFELGIAQGGAGGGRCPRLVLVVCDRAFADAQLRGCIRLALERKVPITLVHDGDARHGGCEFADVINQCPAELKTVAGFANQQLFDPVAVPWMRGEHLCVSTRLLALALGACEVKPPAAAAATGRRRSPSLPSSRFSLRPPRFLRPSSRSSAAPRTVNPMLLRNMSAPLATPAADTAGAGPGPAAGPPAATITAADRHADVGAEAHAHV
jgi:hypothetical protein